MTLEKELEGWGIEMEPDEFRDFLEEQRHIQAPSWNIEQHVHHSRHAWRFSQALAKHFGVSLRRSEAFNEFVNRTLSNIRKCQESKRRPVVTT